MNADEYVAHFKILISRERNAEIDFHTQEIQRVKPEVRQRKGRTLLNMRRQENTRLERESIFRFVRDGKLPINELGIGSNVIVSERNPLEEGLKGQVIQKTGMFIDIQLHRQSNILHKSNLRIDLFVNDATYQSQLKALNAFHDWAWERQMLRDVILHKQKPRLGEGKDIEFLSRLNPSQQLAVRYALREEDFYLIQGPPGTGKTKTSIEIIRQHLKQGKSVLVTADSNMAVDNIMLGLSKYVPVIRIGESPKILPEIQEHTLRRCMEKDVEFKIVEQSEKRIQALRARQRDCLVPNKKNSKGLSYFQITKLAERGQESFGLSLDKLQSMSRWIIAQKKVKELQADIDKRREKIVKRQISKASVICTTNSNANSIYLKDVFFDLVLVDEAGQSTEPSCLLAVAKGKKAILVGDHKQLPPTILSSEAQDLSISMFERMMKNSRYTLLDTQYRMHPLINQFPSEEFYGGQLQSDDSTKTHLLEKKVFEKNVVFVNCKGKEVKRKGATSFYNPSEIDVIFSIIEKYGKHGVTSKDIGVISPYAQQVKELQERLPFVDVHTIDGFQGREKNIIIISLVRSNDRGSLGFLKDLRRLNVALTRAIKELVVIGNEECIKAEPTYKHFLQFVKENGLYLAEKDAITNK